MGDTEEEGDVTGLGIIPGGVRDLSHVLGTLAQGSNAWKMTPLTGWKISGAYWRDIRNQDTALEEHAQTCFLPVTAQRQQIENFLGLWPASQDRPSVLPSLHRAPAPAPLALVLHPTKAQAVDESAHTWRDPSLLGPSPCL